MKLKKELRRIIDHEQKYRFHLDEEVENDFLYYNCQEVHEDIEPSINVNKINYEEKRYLDVKLYLKCFKSEKFKNVLKKYLTTDFKIDKFKKNGYKSLKPDDDLIHFENNLFFEYKTLHLANKNFNNLFISETYDILKKFLNDLTKDMPCEKIILELHDVHHNNMRSFGDLIHTEEQFFEICEKEIDELPLFAGILFCIRNDAYKYPESHRLSKYYLNSDKLCYEDEQMKLKKGQI